MSTKASLWLDMASRTDLSTTSLKRRLSSRSEEHTSELQSPYDLVCLDILDLASCGGYYNLCHSDTLVESQSAGSFAGLLLKVSDYRHKDIYISADPLNWWCYLLSRRRYMAWCAKIDHLVLTLPRWLLHMLYWWSRIVLCLICSSSLSLFRWTLNCPDITTTSWCCFLMAGADLISPLGQRIWNVVTSRSNLTN